MIDNILYCDNLRLPQTLMLETRDVLRVLSSILIIFTGYRNDANLPGMLRKCRGGRAAYLLY